MRDQVVDQTPPGGRPDPPPGGGPDLLVVDPTPLVVDQTSSSYLWLSSDSFLMTWARVKRLRLMLQPSLKRAPEEHKHTPLNKHTPLWTVINQCTAVSYDYDTTFH